MRVSLTFVVLPALAMASILVSYAPPPAVTTSAATDIDTITITVTIPLANSTATAILETTAVPPVFTSGYAPPPYFSISAPVNETASASVTLSTSGANGTVTVTSTVVSVSTSGKLTPATQNFGMCAKFV